MPNFFFEIKTCSSIAAENSHYNTNFRAGVKSDASRSALVAALEQIKVDGWKHIVFVPRFSFFCDEHFSINDLDLLGILWSIECFKNYLCQQQFTAFVHHQTLLIVLLDHTFIKSYNSRLTRWVNRRLPRQLPVLIFARRKNVFGWLYLKQPL